MEEYIRRAVAMFDQLTQAENIRPRLLVVESLDIAGSGFNQVVDHVCQTILGQSSPRIKTQ
jgi:hypothetical protein